jgi:ABC-type multidrug transport system permease subunit
MSTDAAPVVPLLRHSLVSFVRTPASTFFTLLFPVSFLLIIGATAGRQFTEQGVQVSQYLVAPFAVFGVAEASFCVLAVGLARLRDDGVLKRLRGTPVATWAVVASRIGAAIVMSLASTAILVVVGLAFFNVEIVWHKVPAMLLTLVLGIVCCAALGMAVVSLTRSVVSAQAATNGVLIPLAFISHVFIPYATFPAPIDWLAKALPLRHFADALAGTFDPVTTGRGFVWTDLAVLAAWSVAGCAIAAWRFGFEPRGRGPRRVVAVPGPRRATAETVLVPREVGRPGWPALLRTEIGAVVLFTRRHPLPLFFAIVMPALLLQLFPLVYKDIQLNGMPINDAMLVGMIPYGISIAGYVNLPEAVARARGNAELRRLRGTPLPTWIYLVAQVVGSLLVAALAAVVLVVGAITSDQYRIDVDRLPAAILALLASGVCFAALGLALVALMRSAETTNAITLGTLIPLSFVSNVFFVGPELPHYLQVVGDIFPLKHAVALFAAALRPGLSGYGFAWTDLAIVLGWTVVGLAVAARLVRGSRD